LFIPVILGFLTDKRAGSIGIASLLNQDGDGGVLVDVARFLLNPTTGQKPGNLLTNLLKGLFGKKN